MTKYHAHLPIVALACSLLLTACQNRPAPVQNVGPLPDGSHLTATHQLIRPAGQSVEFGGRPVDLVMAQDGRALYAKDNRGVVVIDPATMKVLHEVRFPSGGSSVHGLVLSRDGTRLFATAAQDLLWQINLKPGTEAKPEPGQKFLLPGPGGSGSSAPAGVALSADEKTAWICLSRNNTLAQLNLANGKILQQIPVGVAPYDVVLTADGKRAYVSNWGGRRARPGDATANSAGTETVVDARGVASSGSVSVLDLTNGKEIAQIETGLHPCDLELSADQIRLYVANANSDTITVIHTGTLEVKETIPVRPDPTLSFGSAPNALCLSPDGGTMYVALGGNNAVAVVKPAPGAGQSQIEGFIPAAWFPGAVLLDGQNLYIANVKGLGSRNPPADPKKGWNSHNHLGTVSKAALPDTDTLGRWSAQVRTDARVPEMLRALEKSRAGSAARVRPVPVPARPGQPSVFDHIVYIIKENRTYDQVFGDLPQGNSDPSLCVFGRDVTPNHHALAEQFVLLDNYYCNGVLSADGHAWSMEGFATDYLEKSFGGWPRSYPFSGDDPLSFPPTGFIWDHVLLRGLSFRNYGEMAKSEPRPRNATYLDILNDYRNKTGKITLEHQIYIDTLRRYSCPDSPGWNMRIPDLIRADVFLKEFEENDRKGQWHNLVLIYLPSDHTSGTRPGNPTPRAQVADNDLAVGRIVERISRSQFWPRTCVFVIEDDPQNGFDHVDGHRSICLVVSPYTKRGAVVSQFYNQTSVLHTMCRMLGIAPLNQMVALAPLMTDCFTSQPNLAPYTCLPNQVPLDEMNKATAQLEGGELHWARLSEEQPLDEPDRADEDTLNRIIWHAVKGVDAPYPAHLAGAHGSGLKELGLKFGGLGTVDDDD